MSAAIEPDVLVVGGGPAGLATATALASRGHRVRVVDRGGPGKDKACGEGLMPDAVRSLERLGIDVSGLGLPFRGIRYLDGALTAEGDFPRAPGRGVRRLELHRCLAAAARRAGVDLAWETRVEEVDDGRVVTTRGELRPRWVIGADGLHSDLRRRAGLDGPPAERRRFGVRRHYALAPWTDRVEVYWGEGAEAYVTPVGQELVGVAILWTGAAATFDELSSRFPLLGQRLGDAPAVTKDRGAGQFHQRVRRVVQGNLMLVGDASGYVDPITGEGMGLAFRQSEALADALDRGDPSRYQAAHRRLGRRPWTAARLILALEPRPRLRRRAIRLLGAVPGLFSGILGWMTRD